MTIGRAWLVIGGAFALAAVGCSDAGVTSTAPVMAGSNAPSTPGAAGTAAQPPTPSGGTAAPSTPPQAGAGTPAPSPAGTGATPAPSAGTSAAAGTGSVAGAPAAAGSGSAAGATAGAMAAAGAPGSAGAAGGAAGSSAPPGKCPTGWDCIDLSSFGATATDAAGKPITFSCGNGELTDCNDANPKASCSALSNPFCAHVKVAGMDLVSCGQLCTP
ncbi:MAG TPA: hypothetical protein VJR89_06965 [Polyangiales bacterium]|nr:hypothetical protein [Polyangiales bacterium]